MFRSLATIFSVLFFTSLCFSQTPANAAPVKWEKYSVPEQNVSVLLPRLPVRIGRGNICNGEETRIYGAYTNGGVYVLSVTYAVDPPIHCRLRKSFDQTNFETRLQTLMSGRSGDFIQTDISRAGLTGKKLQNSKGAYFLYNDPAHSRWFELWTMGVDETKAAAKNFLDSFEIEKKTTGKDIKDGAETTVGDDIAPTAEAVMPDPRFRAAGDSGADVILKTPPVYTEVARKHQVNGTVKLRVKLLSNGSIGTITPIQELPDGLTEAAIAVTRKLVFIPAKIKGVLTSTEKIMEYNFNLY